VKATNEYVLKLIIFRLPAFESYKGVIDKGWHTIIFASQG